MAAAVDSRSRFQRVGNDMWCKTWMAGTSPAMTFRPEKAQFARDQLTERQIQPPATQPAVVSELPESVILPE